MWEKLRTIEGKVEKPSESTEPTIYNKVNESLQVERGAIVYVPRLGLNKLTIVERLGNIYRVVKEGGNTVDEVTDDEIYLRDTDPNFTKELLKLILIKLGM